LAKQVKELQHALGKVGKSVSGDGDGDGDGCTTEHGTSDDNE
jgi:hypothetical protein